MERCHRGSRKRGFASCIAREVKAGSSTAGNEIAELNRDTVWEPLFFTSTTENQNDFEKVASATDRQLYPERTKGIWKFDQEKADQATRPYRIDITPCGEAPLVG